MKKLVFAAALTLAATAAQAQGTNQNSRPAQGYTTSGGTSVQPHQQTNSSSTQHRWHADSEKLNPLMAQRLMAEGCSLNQSATAL